jgi:hypothetical protein
VCWMCDSPEMTQADALADMERLVRRYGWAIQYVEGDRYRAPWAYTVGLTACGLPELVVTGLSSKRVAPLLNGLGAHLLHEEPPEPGEQLALSGLPMTEIVRVSTPDAHLGVAVALFGPDIRALQLVWRDDRGKWPWDKGFRSGRWPQPVLGPRALPGGRGTG